MRSVLITVSLLALAAFAGCGGGDDTTTAPAGTTSATPQPSGGDPVAAETKCGTIQFMGDTPATVSALNLPCPKAVAYAKKFSSGELPTQQNLPAGWKLADCTGVDNNPPTPGHSNWPRCTHGKQAFTIQLPGG